MANEPILEQHVKWGEEYVSRGLNVKFSGILEPGVYHGFLVTPGAGMSVNVGPDEDLAISVAVVERGGFNITVKCSGSGSVDIPATAGVYYVCIDAYYAPQQTGYQRVVVRTTPEAHHVILAKVTVPTGATAITAPMISEDGRMTGSPVEWLILNTAKLVEVQTVNLNLMSRLGNLEQWAKQTALPYDPTTVYSPTGNG